MSNDLKIVHVKFVARYLSSIRVSCARFEIVFNLMKDIWFILFALV